MPNDKTQLFEDWLKAKSVEDAAKKERVEIENKIIAAVGLHNHEGSKTHDIEGFKVVLKTGSSRKMDLEKAAPVLAGIREDLRPTKVVADETGIKYLAENEPEIYRMLSAFITVTPSKVGVTVTRKE